jgi:ribosomal protein L11 methylase PrmA
MTAVSVHPASFRDPSGFLFEQEGALYRQVNAGYQAHYDHLMGSGLYRKVVEEDLLIPHVEMEARPAAGEGVYKTIQPEKVPFISYPYEWCFSQLKEAALLTLKLERRALESGMTLKDASAYNVQFRRGRPVWIDTLSFELYEEGKPWVAYRQFCQHYLAPLALMSQRDARLRNLLVSHLDGIPLDLACRLLPLKSRLSTGLALHLHLHAKAQSRYADLPKVSHRGRLSRNAFLGLLSSLELAIQGLRWKPPKTSWSSYYEKDTPGETALQQKKEIIQEWVGLIQPPPKTAWDLGANTGLFSRILSRRGIHTLALDSDPACAEENYRQVLQAQESHLLPLWVDLTNPTPSLGWENQERDSLLQRGPADLVLALALVHHLVLGNNLPLKKIADFLGDLCRWLIVEFVPPEDPQVQRLLSGRRLGDLHGCGKVQAEEAFSSVFIVRQRTDLPGSQRTLYLMEKKA